MHTWNCIALLAIVIITTTAGNLRTVKRRKGWNVGVVGGFINSYTESTVPDRILCEWRCFNTLLCYGVTYRSDDLSCIMYNGISTFVHNEEIENEISMFEQLTVTHVWDLTVSLSPWTVEAAMSICELLDLQLMTYEELDQARGANSYFYQRCGYVKEGTTTSPQQEGMVNCSLTDAQVFCRVP